MTDRTQLHRDDYALLRRAIPLEWLDGLRAVFEAGVKPSGEWPVPRGLDWRHSLLDCDLSAQRPGDVVNVNRPGFFRRLWPREWRDPYHSPQPSPSAGRAALRLQ